MNTGERIGKADEILRKIAEVKLLLNELRKEYPCEVADLENACDDLEEARKSVRDYMNEQVKKDAKERS